MADMYHPDTNQIRLCCFGVLGATLCVGIWRKYPQSLADGKTMSRIKCSIYYAVQAVAWCILVYVEFRKSN